MRFKFWLQPGTEECYHELLENGTSIYFMYEILNAYNHSILALVDVCMTHAKSDSSAKYMSVFFHVYHVEKILASIQEVHHFDNSSINVHVRVVFIR
jgi:hypothetical protein